MYVKTAPASYSRLSDVNGKLTIAPNPMRHSIILGTPAGRSTVVQVGASDGSAAGVLLGAAGTTALELACDRHGTGVRETITLTDTAGAQQTFAWVEFTYAP